jgi:DmsE family decaheme c-type cytochrome
MLRRFFTRCGRPPTHRRVIARLRAKVAISTLLAGVACSGLLAVVQPVAAGNLEHPAYQDEAYSALVGYTQQLGGERPKPSAAAAAPASSGIPPRDADHKTYFDLLDFVQLIGKDEQGGAPLLARATGSIDPEIDQHHNYSAVPGGAHAALADFLRQHDGGRPDAGHSDNAALDGQNVAAPLVAEKLAAVKGPSPGADVAATNVGNQTCLKCHASQAATFNDTLMGKYGKVRPGTMNCENCHGPGSAHVKAGGGKGVGGLITFRPDDLTRTAEENNAICLACHDKGSRILWRGSVHEQREVACTNCHTVMRNVTPKFGLARKTEIETCFQCHKNKRAEIWRTSHMPVREGKMKCSDCHSPHGSYAESLLREATINDTCYKCHAEKRGPFLWEHAPVRENCASCHDPHGSINDFMLKISRPRLCQTCHATLSGHPGNPRNPASIYAINRECQNCHSQHHGSNSPSGPRFTR